MKDRDALVIREMRPGEQAFLVALTLEIWDKVSVAKNITDRLGSINGHPWTDHKADQVLMDVDSAEVVLVGEMDGRIVAFATLRYDRKYSTGTVGHLGVASDVQGAGLGRRMLRAALDRFRRDGLTLARIDTLAQNDRARKLYQSEGFTEVGRSIHLFRPL